MGFFDQKIKKQHETCPRLVILSVNSIFQKHHPLDAEVIYLDKEQTASEDIHETFMDMLIQIEESKYHFEFQLLEDNMAIRMYEYGVKETIRELEHISNQNEIADRYEIEIIMPAQAVIFLAGYNKKEEITVHMTLPDGQKVVYNLPCISASVTVEELIARNLFILIPFQQVQLNQRMNRISSVNIELKHELALQMYEYHEAVKNGLEKLESDGIITTEEFYNLIETLSDIESYLIEKDENVKKEVKKMGDEDYVFWSDQMRNEGRQEGQKQLIEKLIRNGKTPTEIAEFCDFSIEEVTEVARKVVEYV